MTTTTREIEKKKNENLLIASIVISISMGILIFVVGIIVYDNLPRDKEYSCDIGQEEIAGDFIAVNSIYAYDKQCAVQDCIAFNDYQIKIKGSQRCVV